MTSAPEVAIQQPAPSAADLRIEPQFGPPGNALRQYSPGNRLILAGGKLYDAQTLAIIRRDAGEQLVADGTAIRNQFVVRDIETWKIVADFTDYFKDSYTARALMSDDGTHLAWFGNRAWSESGWTQIDRLQVLRSDTQAVIVDAHLEGANVQALQFADEGRELWVWLSFHHLAIFSLATGERRDRHVSQGQGKGPSLQWWTANRLGLTITTTEIAKAPASAQDAHRNFLTVEDARTGNPIANLCRPSDDDLAANHVAWGDRSATFSHDDTLFGVLVARDEEGFHQYECEAVIFETSAWTIVKRFAVTPFNPWVRAEDRPVLAFDPTNRRLQVGHEEYDLVTGHPLRSFANEIDQRLLARSRGSNAPHLVRVHHDGVVVTWDLVAGEQVGLSRIAGRFLALSEDGALVASYRSGHFQNLVEQWGDDHAPFKDDGEEFAWKSARASDAIVVQHTRTGEVLHALRTCVSRYEAVEFTPDNSSLTASFWDYGAASTDLWSRGRQASQYHHYLISWDLKRGSLRWITDEQYGSARSFTFSGDGRLFATFHVEGQNEITIRVLDSQTGTTLWRFPLDSTFGDGIENLYFSSARPDLVACPRWGKVLTFNLVTGAKDELPIESRSLVLSNDRAYFAWAGGIRKWGEEADLMTFTYAREMRGVDGLFRGDAFYGGFWQDRSTFTAVLYYRLSDGELLGGWQCGFPIDEVRVIEARVAGGRASLVGLSERQARIWADQFSADGLLVEFLPAGALMRDGNALPRWTAEAIPHLRAYRGTHEIALSEYLNLMEV